MNWKNFTLFSVAAGLILLVQLMYSETNRYNYDFSEPATVVQAASKMLMNSDYEAMLIITELKEKKLTVDTLEQIKADSKLRETLKKESDKILGFEITGTEIYTNDISNQLVIVSTKWTIKIDNSDPKNPQYFVRIHENDDPDKTRRNKIDSTVYVDYLLKKFDDKWKIISKKTR